MRGGKRQGAGRKHGSKTQKTVDIALNAAAAGVTPLEYLLEIMRDPIPKDVDALAKAQMTINRMDAAKAAAPYVHPRLQAIEHSGPDGENIPVKITVNYVGNKRRTSGKT